MRDFKNQSKRSHIVAIISLLFVVATMTYFSSTMAKRLTDDEKTKMVIWAEAYRILGNESSSDDANNIALEIIRNNESIPLLVLDASGSIISDNIKLPKDNQQEFLERKLAEFQADDLHPPIPVTVNAGGEVYTSYIYYDSSILLKRLSYYPLWQVTIITFFMVMAYLFFNISKRSEEDRVWVGLSKETAHQLGTPISSLMAWIELMRCGQCSHEMADEMQKDITRLQKVANRFSKIGSKPTLVMHNINEVLDNSAVYMSSRISKKVNIIKNFSKDQFVPVMLNTELFEWVVENLIKNAVDAMRGGGNITIDLEEDDKNVTLDFTDEGKGIPKNKFKQVFIPGYSSKKRGWGLGLSFTKRIMKEYHGGKIFVKKSELNVGTTFRIIIPKAIMEENS